MYNAYDMTERELEIRVNSIFKASQSQESGLRHFYMCPVNKVKDIVELCCAAYALSLKEECTEEQKEMLNSAMQAMFKRGVYEDFAERSSPEFINTHLRYAKTRPSEEVMCAKYFGPGFVSSHMQ
jgi:pimeloyl-CoA synthetase